MRPIDPVRHANVGNPVSSTRFRLDAASTAHIVNLLTNQYSDRLLAALRELSTNAADSHVSAKTNVPIRVTLPSRINPNLVVEDFGLGLSLDDLEGLYSAYGASTKRDDDEVNGTLGIGSKAPLAYGDTFSVQSRRNGLQVLAVVSKDTDGVPVLQVLDTSATSEPNGVRIEVPIQERHFYDLQNKAEDLFSYWPKGSVLVNGKQPASIRDDEDLVWLDDDVAVSLRRDQSVIVQHNVAYPVDRYRLGLPYEVIVFVPTGTVNFTPSRESLEYTERTDEVLNLIEDYAKDAFHRVIRAKIEAATTTYERLVLVNEWRQYVPEVVQDFFGKGNPFTIRPAAHGFGWRYRPTAYKNKANKVEWVRASDLIGDWPIVVGYDLKTLTPKAKDKADIFFKDSPGNQQLFLPTGTDLTLAEGRDAIYTWDEIEAAVPDSVVKKANGGYKGQTQYSVKIPGSGWDSYTLREAKEAIAESEITTVVYATHAASDLTSYLPDAVVFEISARQVDKIVRETGAIDGHDLAAQRRQKAFEALTTEDRLAAAVRYGSSHWAYFVGVLDEIDDPDVKAFVEAWSNKNQPVSVTLQAYLDTGGTLRDIASGVDTREAVLDRRYPLIESTYYIRKNIPDALIYINAKHAALQSATEAPASPTLRKDQS